LRQRSRRSIEWWDEAGDRHLTTTVVKAPSGLGGAVSKDARLVNVWCPGGHLVAVLARLLDGPPALVVRGGAVPVITAVLTSGGLQPTITTAQGVSAAPTAPQEALSLRCPSCAPAPTVVPLVAATLLDAAKHAGTRPADLRLGASH
jgi:hypothetical protein